MTPFSHDKRRQRTPQERARIFAECGGKCALCTRKLGPADRWDLDHAIALEAGGSDDDDNLRPVCAWCHTGKTSEDHATGGKIRRSYTKHHVPREFRRHKAWPR
jgi:5-methylcytosine-specific restriction endonuclease McrA